MAYPLEVGIGATWFGRRKRFFLGGAGVTLESSGGCGGNTLIWVYGGCTRLSNMWLESSSSETRFSTGFLVQDWSFILGNLVLNSSTIVADSVISFRHM